jgi:protein phosphatase
VLFNVGDSRVYLYSCGRLLRLTRDHSLVQELVDSGEITAEEAFDHPRKNVISRCLGGGSIGSEPDVASYDPGPGELLLIASDGLGDMLRDHEIEALVREQVAAAGPAGLAQALVDAANAAGGKDNVTVVAAVWAPVG